MDSERIFLLPGEYQVARRACEMATLLGSCVAVCLRHREKAYAGMNHFLLADSPGGNADRGRYGDTATEAIIWLLSKIETAPGKFTGQLYGGAAVIGHLGRHGDIGLRNIEAARKVLKKHNIRITKEDVGGTLGRRIYFDTGSGNVTVKIIQKTQEVEKLAKNRERIAMHDTRILVVDDSALVRKILCKAIAETPGMEVCGEAEDAYEARDLVLSENPDVISLDIIMPKMDGIKFLKILSEHFPKPVVICSTIAKANSDVARRAKQYGAVDIVDKDKLQLYRGLDVVKAAYIPKLRRAAGIAVHKKKFT